MEAYIEEHTLENEEEKEKTEMARRKIEDLEELVKLGKKKYVRIAEGAELYSVGLHTFESWAKDAGVARKVKGVVLVNTEKNDKFIESFGHIAQSAERLAVNREVVGSIPSVSAIPG